MAGRSSLPPGLPELISLFDTMRPYPQAAFRKAESLADVAIANEDMEFAKQLYNIGAQDCSSLLLKAYQMACPLLIIHAVIQAGAKEIEVCIDPGRS